MVTKINIGIVLVFLIAIIGIAGVMMLEPISQDINYHLFIDNRTILSIPNFWNIVSNMPFLLVGVYGLISLIKQPNYKILLEIRSAYIVFFSGITLVALGSTYYHFSPSNTSLIYDRLPMTIAFMALFSIVIAEFISTRLAKIIFWPLIFVGAFSVIYWAYTESIGEGDLRFYILVQFIPVLMMPVIWLFFKSKFTQTNAYWLLLGSYILAKLFEYFDVLIFNSLLVISGHSIKHLVAALGIVFLVKAYKKREPC